MERYNHPNITSTEFLHEVMRDAKVAIEDRASSDKSKRSSCCASIDFTAIDRLLIEQVPPEPWVTDMETRGEARFWGQLQ